MSTSKDKPRYERAYERGHNFIQKLLSAPKNWNWEQWLVVGVPVGIGAASVFVDDRKKFLDRMDESELNFHKLAKWVFIVSLIYFGMNLGMEFFNLRA